MSPGEEGVQEELQTFQILTNKDQLKAFLNRLKIVCNKQLVT